METVSSCSSWASCEASRPRAARDVLRPEVIVTCLHAFCSHFVTKRYLELSISKTKILYVYMYIHPMKCIGVPSAADCIGVPGCFVQGSACGLFFLRSELRKSRVSLLRFPITLQGFWHLMTGDTMNQTGFDQCSCNYATPDSSILIGFSIINHPFWANPIFGNTRCWLPSAVLFGLPFTTPLQPLLLYGDWGVSHLLCESARWSTVWNRCWNNKHEK